MIYLGDCHTNIHVVADQWVLRLRDFLFKKHERKLRIQRDGITIASFYTYFEKMKGMVDTRSDLDDSEKAQVADKLEWFRTHLRQIVLAGEKELREFSNEDSPKLMKDIMKSLYEDFTQSKDENGISNAHFIFKELNIRTCPYCNRHYTFTLNKGAKAAPEFDHFYDKADHPLLAVSFYNLVPSCHT